MTKSILLSGKTVSCSDTLNVVGTPGCKLKSGCRNSNRFEKRKAFALSILGGMQQKTLFKTKMHPSRGRYDGFIEPYSQYAT
jgi:hypothetical protein